MSGPISPKEWKCVWTQSLGCCAFPGCRKKLVENATQNDSSAVIGKIAHIRGEKPGSARYDSNMTTKERSSEKNLILLCGEHHDIIDSQQNEYTLDKLLKYKKDHEIWAANVLRSVTTDITFAELKVIMDYLVNSSEFSDGSLDLISPKDKIIRNKLSEQIERLIKIGSLQVKQVGDYIKSCKDINFEGRLIKGFSNEYTRLKKEGLEGDDIFYALSTFASNGSCDPKIISAGLTVLSYLFERCEVFEK